MLAVLSVIVGLSSMGLLNNQPVPGLPKRLVPLRQMEYPRPPERPMSLRQMEYPRPPEPSPLLKQPGLQSEHREIAHRREQERLATEGLLKPVEESEGLGGLIEVLGLRDIKNMFERLEPVKPGMGLGGAGFIPLEQHKIHYPKLFKEAWERELKTRGGNLEKTAKAWHGGTNKQKDEYWKDVLSKNKGVAPTTPEELHKLVREVETGGEANKMIYTKVLPKWVKKIRNGKVVLDSTGKPEWEWGSVSSAFGDEQMIGGPGENTHVTASLKNMGLRYKKQGPGKFKWVVIDRAKYKKAVKNDPEYLNYLKKYQSDATEKINKTRKLLNKIPVKKRTDTAVVREALKQLEPISDTYKALSQHPRPGLGLIGGGL